MHSSRLAAIFSRLEWVLWGLLALFLPITSLPLLSKLGRGAMVAPASLIALGGLAVIWFIPYLVQRGRLPAESAPLSGFILVVILSSARAVFLPTPVFRSTPVWMSMLEGLVTLAIGMLFYLVTAVWINRTNRLQIILRLINWSGVILVAWSLVQAYFWNVNLRWPAWIRTIQDMVSVGTLYAYRVTGFAFEPSWLAHQLNVLYIPFWLAATITGKTVHKRKLWIFSLENGLLLGGVALLFLTNARIGMLAFLLVMASLALYFCVLFVRWLQRKFDRKWKQTLASAAFILLVLVAGFGGVFGIGYRMSKTDIRMKSLFDLETLRTKSFIEYAEPLGFSARIIYWQAGWEIYSQYPMLGVGIGNAGYYFPEKLDSFAWGLFEVRDIMYRAASIPNIKNFWVRILAETGVAGFACIAVWLLVLWRMSRNLQKDNNPILRICGVAGSFALIAFIGEGFSLDTFALPYFWISAGLLSAAYQIAKKTTSA
jgi:O-antigen ligase